MRLFRVTPPASPPVTLAEVYSHLRLDPQGSPPSHPDDDLLGQYIGAATDYLDGSSGVLGRCMISQDWRAEAALPDIYGRFQIPMPGAVVTSVEILKDGAYESSPASLWTFRDMVHYTVLRPKAALYWPSHDSDESAFRIAFTAGYGPSPADVPGPLRTAILLLVGGFYENREDIVTGGNPQVLPGGVDRIIAPYRIRPNG